MNVGQRIREHREAAGLLQDDLAKSCYVSRQTISNWERNRTLPDIESLKRIADTFGTTVDALIGDDAPEIAQRVDEEAREFLILNVIFDASVLANLFLTFARSEIASGSIEEYLLTLFWGFLLGAMTVSAILYERIRRRHGFTTRAEINRYLIERAVVEDTVPARAARFLLKHDFVTSVAILSVLCTAGIALNERYRTELVAAMAVGIGGSLLFTALNKRCKDWGAS